MGHRRGATLYWLEVRLEHDFMSRKPGTSVTIPQAAGRGQVGRAGALPPFAALRAFDAVGRLGGMRRAAATLCVDHTVISRHVRALEKWMGVVLVERSGGAARLTESGRRYHARIAPAIAELIAATDDQRRLGPVDRLRIWSVPGFGFLWLAPQLAKFRAAHPQCQLEFHPTDDAADFNHDSADVDIRYQLDETPQVSLRYVRSLEISRPPTAACVHRSMTDAIPE